MVRLFAALVALALAVGGAAPTAAQAPVAPATAPSPPTTQLRDAGLIADYFAADPATASRGAVVVLGGSEGGLGGRSLARRLAAEGLDAITVSYFGEPGQPAKLDRVPIEPVGRAVEWLRGRTGGDEPIAVVGVSKGAELALLIASRDDRIKAVVAGAPTHVTWQGIDQMGGETGASWTHGGEPLPYTPYDMSKGFQGIFRLYSDSLAAAPAEAEIAVERIAGPVLLVSASDDGLWPAADMAGRIQRRLVDKGFAHPVESLVYEGAGHAVFGPPLSASATPQMRANLAFLGGTPEGVASARADGWPKVVAFLKSALAE